MIGVTEHLLEKQPGLLHLSRPGQAFNIPERTHRETSFAAAVHALEPHVVGFVSLFCCIDFNKMAMDVAWLNHSLLPNSLFDREITGNLHGRLGVGREARIKQKIALKNVCILCGFSTMVISNST